MSRSEMRRFLSSAPPSPPGCKSRALMRRSSDSQEPNLQQGCQVGHNLVIPLAEDEPVALRPSSTAPAQSCQCGPGAVAPTSSGPLRNPDESLLRADEESSQAPVEDPDAG